MAKSAAKLTKYVKKVTILTSDAINSFYGGLYGSAEAAGLSVTDPLVAGHIHDGQHIDGHAQKIDVSSHVVGRLENANLADDAVSIDNIIGFTEQSSAIPEFELIMGTPYYSLDLSAKRTAGAKIDSLFDKKAGYQWGESSISEFSNPLIGDFTEAVGIGLMHLSILQTNSVVAGSSLDGRYIQTDALSTQNGGWASISATAGITSGNLRPRFSIKLSISVLTNGRFFIGFNEDGFEITPTFIGFGDDPSANYVGFQFSGPSLRGDTNWQIVHNIIGGAQTKIDTGIAAAIDTVLVFEIEYITSNSVKFSILDHTYTNSLFSTTTTIQPLSATEWFAIVASGDWEGGGTQDMLRFYHATLLNKDRSDA